MIGAHGKVGKIIVQKMAATKEFEPIALIRNVEQKTWFEKLKVPVRIASIEDSIESIAIAMDTIDAIVFTAGSGAKTGADKTLTVDLDGAVKCMIAAEQKGINRFVMISALKTRSRKLWELNPKLKPYLVAKYYADQYLQNTHLNYTILRPGRLLDEPGTGKITIEDALANESVTREDVADVALVSLQNENAKRKIIDFNNGENAIANVIASV